MGGSEMEEYHKAIAKESTVARVSLFIVNCDYQGKEPEGKSLIVLRQPHL